MSSKQAPDCMKYTRYCLTSSQLEIPSDSMTAKYSTSNFSLEIGAILLWSGLPIKNVLVLFLSRKLYLLLNEPVFVCLFFF